MRVSIVLCNYNYAPFLDEAIASAVAQSYVDKEVIVVDDGSTDTSREIVARWGDAVRPIYKSNGGQVSAYNAGFQHVTGDVVLFLDSDDLLDRDACARVIEAFDDDTVKVHFRLRLVNPRNEALGPEIPERLAEGDLADHLRIHGDLYDSAPGSGNAYRVSALRRLMPLPEDPKDPHGADFFAIYGISLLGRIGIAAERSLGSYRVHRRGASVLLGFGNASHCTEEPARMHVRYERMQRWVLARLGPVNAPVAVAPNFSLEKQRYAEAIFSRTSYVQGLHVGSSLLVSDVLPAIGHVKNSWAFRLGLTCWAVAVLLLPRKAGFPLARYVCNPASR
jgi:glycosyltransferase involved in cell wall biosynthesis